MHQFSPLICGRREPPLAPHPTSAAGAPTKPSAFADMRFDPTTVSNEAIAYGWWEHDYQWSQGELVILRKYDQSGDTMQLNVWCTTGTVGSYLHHPRQGKTQLFRRECWTMHDLRDIFYNPRVHGHGGYHDGLRQHLLHHVLFCPDVTR